MCFISRKSQAKFLQNKNFHMAIGTSEVNLFFLPALFPLSPLWLLPAPRESALVAYCSLLTGPGCPNWSEPCILLAGFLPRSLLAQSSPPLPDPVFLAAKVMGPPPSSWPPSLAQVWQEVL